MSFKKKINYGSSYDTPKRRWVSRFPILLAVVLLGAFFGYRKYIGMTLDKANGHMAENRLDEAEAKFQSIAGLPFSNGRGEDGLGVIDLLRNDLDAAKDHFRIVLEHKPSKFGADPAVVFEKIVGAGLYETGRIYREFLKNWKDPRDLEPYLPDFAAIALGNRDIESARAILDAVPEGIKSSERFQNLEKATARIEAGGQIPVLLDRRGVPILSYDLRTGNHQFASPKLFEGWTAENADILDKLPAPDRLNRVRTTIDLNLQKAAYEAIRGYRGTMILMEPGSGDILAALGTEGFDPFAARFEPGSVIKVLTYGIFLGERGDPEPYAPKTYPGNKVIGGRIFYDWTTHGKLENIEEGMAVSCNLMFAQMGIDLGWPTLGKGFRKLFEGQFDMPFSGTSFGTLVREPENAWEIGRAAIGLDILSTTSLGLVLLPAAIGNRGALWLPRLFQQATNLEGKVYATHEPQSYGDLFSSETAAKLGESMGAALADDRGTGRRAQVDFVQAAMKTGTAGDRPFDSIMIGFFPIAQPKVAFAFFLSQGGKCEINGAKVAKQLQEQIKALAPEYLK